jgi:hypothetical protein
MSRVSAYNVFRSYMSKKGFSMDQLSDIWAVAENKQLFKDLTKKLQGPGVAAKHIANAFSNRHGDNMFRDVGGGAGGTPPESKISPPDDLESWKDVLQKVGVSAALAATFRDVYSAGVNAVSAKAFQQAFSSPEEALSTLARLGETGLIDAEPLALALTALETDTPAARSSALIGSGDISGVGGFVRAELAAGEREREGAPSPVSEEKAGEFVSTRAAQLDEAERKRIHNLIVPHRGEQRLSDEEILDAIEKAAPILSKTNRACCRYLRIAPKKEHSPPV